MNSISMTYALVFALSLTACDGSPGIEPVNRKPHAELVAALKGAGQERIAQGSQTLFDADGAGKLSPRISPIMVTTGKDGGGAWTISALDDDKVGSTLLIGAGFQQGVAQEPRTLPSFDRAKATTAIGRLKACGAGYYPDMARRMLGNGWTRRYSGDVSYASPSTLATARARRQHEIDSNVLNLKIDGEHVEITQGDLRRIMEKRVIDLKQERARLLQAGDAAAIRRNEELTRKYEREKGPAVESLPSGDDFKPVFADVYVKANGEFGIVAVDQYGAFVIVADGNEFGLKSQKSKD
jgi:hypothetical protein